MSEAKEYLKKVGLIQSPYISQERVIKHLEKFAKEQVDKQLLLHNVVGRSEQLKAVEKLKDFAYEVCPLHREDDLEKIVGSL